MGSILEIDRPVFPLASSARIAPEWQDGLVLAWVGARGIYTLFPRLRGSATDLEKFQQGPYGLGLQTKDSATNSGLTLPGFKGLEQVDNITLFALTAEPSTANPTAAYSQRATSTGNSSLDLALNRTNGGATSAGTVSLYFRSSGAQNRGVRFDGILDGKWHALAISHLTGSSYVGSFDGGQRTAASTSTPSGTIITGDQVAVIGGRNGVTEGVRGPLAIVLAWARPWSQRDLDRVTADPARLFVPRSIWVPVSAGGGGVTVALTGQGGSFSQGSFALVVEKVLSGEAATFTPGLLGGSVSITLIGQSAAFTAGSVVPSVAIAAIGLQAAFSPGTLTPSSSSGDTVALLGQAATFAQTAPSTSVTIALTGIAATMAAGILSASSGTATITVKAGSWLRYKKLQ